jgi:hypothetical protein
LHRSKIPRELATREEFILPLEAMRAASTSGTNPSVLRLTPNSTNSCVSHSAPSEARDALHEGLDGLSPNADEADEMHSDETIHQRGICLTATQPETDQTCPKIPSGLHFCQPEIAQLAARQAKELQVLGSILAQCRQTASGKYAPTAAPQPHKSASTKQQLLPRRQAEHRIRASHCTHDPCNSRRFDADNQIPSPRLSTTITAQHFDDVPDKSRSVVPERDTTSLDSDTKTLTFPTWSRQRCIIASVSSLAPGDTSNSLEQEQMSMVLRKCTRTFIAQWKSVSLVIMKCRDYQARIPLEPGHTRAHE